MFDFLAGKKHFSCFLVTIVTPDGIYQKVVDEKAFTIGRTPENHLSLPEPEISRVHLQVTAEKDQVVISDMGSSNKTFLNGEPIAPHNPRIIGQNDEIRLGKTQITLRIALHEKLFKENFVKDSKMAENEKKQALESILGAHQEAKRLIVEAQTLQTKMMESAQAKAAQMLEQFKKDTQKQMDTELAEMRKKAAAAFPEEVAAQRAKAQEQLTQEKNRLSDSLKSEFERARTEMKDNVQAEKEKLQSAYADLKKEVEDLELAKVAAEKEFNQLKVLKEEAVEARKKELEDIQQKHVEELAHKLEKQEKEEQSRWEKEIIVKKKEVADFEGALSAMKNEIEHLKASKKSILDESQEFHAKKMKLEDEYRIKCEELAQAEKKLQKQIEDTQKVQAEAAKLKLDLETDRHRLEEFEQQFQVKLNEEKKKLEKEAAEFRAESERKFAEAMKVDEEKVKKLKAQRLEEINHIQNTLIQDLHQKLQKGFAQKFGADNLAVFTEASMADIKSVFEETLPKVSIETMQTDSMSAKITKKQRQQKYKWAAASMMMGILLTVGIQLGHDKFVNRTLASVMDEQQKERDAEMAERRFNPEQTLDVRATYTDSVIYTKHFVEAYMDEGVQKRWLKAASLHMYEKWRIPEEKTIEVLAAEKTLIQGLETKRQNINPDFVKQNIQKMYEYEDAVTEQMAKLLGTRVKLEAFRKFETKFFTKEIVEKEDASLGH